MPYEMMVGLTVRDPEQYAAYRAAMTPLLERRGGGFRHDFEIARVLRSDAAHPINRVFAIYFADEAAMRALFADPDYLAIKARLFDGAVGGTTILGQYER